MYRNEDDIASAAWHIVEDVREVSPPQTHQALTNQCRLHPDRMAQVLMALAIWVNPDEPRCELDARVAQAARTRVRTVLGVPA